MKIIAFGDKNYKFIAHNWALHMKYCGIADYVIYSLDKVIYNYLLDNDIKTELLECELFEGPIPYNWDWATRLKYMYKLINDGHDVLHSDLDAVWLRNPLKFVRSSHLGIDLRPSDNDIICSTGTMPEHVYKKVGTTICMGWVFFKSNKRVKQLFRDLLSIREDFHDQVAINELLFENPPEHVTVYGPSGKGFTNSKTVRKRRSWTHKRFVVDGLKILLLGKKIISRKNKHNFKTYVAHPCTDSLESREVILRRLGLWRLDDKAECPYQRMLTNIKVVNTINNKPAAWQYRLGDAVFLGNCAITKILHNESPFTETIGYKFLENMINNRKLYNWDYMRSLCKVDYTIPENQLTVHIRAGDWKSICRDSKSIIQLINNIENVVKQRNIDRVIIVTAYHWCKMPPKRRAKLLPANMDTIERIIRSVSKYVAVDVQSNDNPDEDFKYLVNSNHLMVTQGFFSILAGVCNDNNVYSGIDKDVIITGTVGVITEKIRGNIGEIINKFKHIQLMEIPNHVSLNTLGDDSELNYFLQENLKAITK